MIEFIECPLLKKRITLERCVRCPENYHRGVRLILYVEDIKADGGAGDARITQILEHDLPAFKQVHTTQQITTRERFLLCAFPRHVPIETVEA